MEVVVIVGGGNGRRGEPAIAGLFKSDTLATSLHQCTRTEQNGGVGRLRPRLYINTA